MLVGHHHLLGARPHPLCLVAVDRIDPVRHSSLWQCRLLWVLARDDGLSKRGNVSEDAQDERGRGEPTALACAAFSSGVASGSN
jgi:hypothetical protein